MFILEQKRKKDLIQKQEQFFPSTSLSVLIFFPLLLVVKDLVTITGPQTNFWGFRFSTKVSLCIFPILDETENSFPKMSKKRFAGRWGPECPCVLYSPKDGSCVTHTAQNTSVEKALRMGPQGALGTAVTWLRVLSGLGRVFCFLSLVSLGEKVGWLVLGKGSACQQRARRESSLSKRR